MAHGHKTRVQFFLLRFLVFQFCKNLNSRAFRNLLLKLLQNFHDFLGVIFTTNAVDHLTNVRRDERPVLFFAFMNYSLGSSIFDRDG